VLTLLAQGAPSNFPSGPDELERYLNAFYILFGLGFIIGMLGGLFKSRTLQAVGVTLVFMGTGLFFVAVAQFD